MSTSSGWACLGAPNNCTQRTYLPTISIVDASGAANSMAIAGQAATTQGRGGVAVTLACLTMGDMVVAVSSQKPIKLHLFFIMDTAIHFPTYPATHRV